MDETKPSQKAGSSLAKKNNDRKYYFFALRIVGNFGANIAIPVVIFVLIGQYLDDKYHRGPLLTVAGFIIAALISGKMIFQKAKKYGEEYQKIDKDTQV